MIYLCQSHSGKLTGREKEYYKTNKLFQIGVESCYRFKIRKQMRVTVESYYSFS